MSSNELRALGRLSRDLSASPARRRLGRTTPGGRGVAIRRSGLMARRQPRIPRVVVWALTAALAPGAWLAVVAAGQSEPSSAPAGDRVAVAGRQAARRPAAVPVSRSRGQGLSPADPAVFATVDGLELTLPHPRPQLVAFHEASHAESLELQPRGQLNGNDNPIKFVAGSSDPQGSYHVLPSLGRPRRATSAVDIALPDGGTVTAPVSGTVAEVVDYPLYGRRDDWRIVLQPSGRPDLAVVLLHLEDPQVAAGDRVVAGETPLAAGRRLPFDSHVDYVVGQRAPHLHLEVKPALLPEPLDPNAPALPALDDA